jgi:hypothetical protein
MNLRLSNDSTVVTGTGIAVICSCLTAPAGEFTDNQTSIQPPAIVSATWGFQ